MLTLIIGNKNYSSWSFRPWLVLKHANIPFKETMISLYGPDSDREILAHSPSGKVPVLVDGELRVWESLAICEYLAERFPNANLWPKNGPVRAFARSVSHEMHAGFMNLRKKMPMNCRARHAWKDPGADVQEDIDRITAIWRTCRDHYGEGGDMLFGRFTIADAMFAPVVSRFVSYGVPLDATAKAYADAVWSLPAFQEWLEGANAEAQRIPEFDTV